MELRFRTRTSSLIARTLPYTYAVNRTKLWTRISYLVLSCYVAARDPCFLPGTPYFLLRIILALVSFELFFLERAASVSYCSLYIFKRILYYFEK